MPTQHPPRLPLHPLPLSYFLSPDGTPASSRASPLKPATKRSRSPSALLTPAKRRMLRVEGVMLSPSSTSSSSSSRGRSPNVDSSLSRRIDALSPSMPPSPSTRPQRDQHSPTHVQAHAPSTGRYRTRSSTSSTEITPSHSPASSTASSGVRRAANPITVPRRVPSPPDPQSEHYPGFDIYYDTCTTLRSAASRQCSVEPYDDDEPDLPKENVAPRKKAKKTVSAPENDPALSFERPQSPKLHPASNPVTPFCASPVQTPQTPHHVRGSRPFDKSGPMFSPGKTPRSGTELAERRRALEMEVDEVCSDDDESL